MKHTILICLLTLTGISCKQKHTERKEVAGTAVQSQAGNQYNTTVNIDTTTIGGITGIITSSDKYQFGDKIKVLDSYGKVTRELVSKEEYQPVMADCISIDPKYYKVKLENGKEGFIDRSNELVKFNTWEQHILTNVFSVDFNSKINPVMKEPGNTAAYLPVDAEESYHPVKISEDWLQIKWGTEGAWQFGWIKWKDEKKLLVELFYFS